MIMLTDIAAGSPQAVDDSKRTPAAGRWWKAGERFDLVTNRPWQPKVALSNRQGKEDQLPLSSDFPAKEDKAICACERVPYFYLTLLIASQCKPPQMIRWGQMFGVQSDFRCVTSGRQECRVASSLVRLSRVCLTRGFNVRCRAT